MTSKDKLFYYKIICLNFTTATKNYFQCKDPYVLSVRYISHKLPSDVHFALK